MVGEAAGEVVGVDQDSAGDAGRGAGGVGVPRRSTRMATVGTATRMVGRHAMAPPGFHRATPSGWGRHSAAHSSPVAWCRIPRSAIRWSCQVFSRRTTLSRPPWRQHVPRCRPSSRWRQPSATCGLAAMRQWSHPRREAAIPRRVSERPGRWPSVTVISAPRTATPRNFVVPSMPTAAPLLSPVISPTRSSARPSHSSPSANAARPTPPWRGHRPSTAGSQRRPQSVAKAPLIPSLATGRPAVPPRSPRGAKPSFARSRSRPSRGRRRRGGHHWPV